MYGLTPTVHGWGFFMRAASLAVWNCSSSSHVGEAGERGSKPWCLPQRCSPLSSRRLRHVMECRVLLSDACCAMRGHKKRRGYVWPTLPGSALTRYLGLVCWGCSTVCRRTSTRRRSRMGCLSPWVECLIYAPRARERRRAHATFCVTTRSAVRRLGMGPDDAG